MTSLEKSGMLWPDVALQASVGSVTIDLRNDPPKIQKWGQNTLDMGVGIVF